MEEERAKIFEMIEDLEKTFNGEGTQENLNQLLEVYMAGITETKAFLIDKLFEDSTQSASSTPLVTQMDHMINISVDGVKSLAEEFQQLQDLKEMIASYERIEKMHQAHVDENCETTPDKMVCTDEKSKVDKEKVSDEVLDDYEIVELFKAKSTQLLIKPETTTEDLY